MSSEASGFTLRQLCEEVESKHLSNSNQKSILASLQTLSTRLSSQNSIRREPDDAEYVPKLSLWISRAILPTSDVVSYDAALDEPTPSTQTTARAFTKQRALHCLKALKALSEITTAPEDVDPAILISLLAHTSPLDPWTDGTTRSLANSLLEQFTDQLQSTEFQISHVLQDFIRPLFAKSKRIESITATGRKAMPSSAPPTRFDAARELDHENQPWRYECVYAVTVLGWTLTNVDSETIKPSLHLILPPLLHLLDTSSHTLRYRGLLILPSFLSKLSPQLLTQTGLGSVFEDAIEPTLMYLPTLTPLRESEILVPAAWNAIFVLCDVWFGTPSSQPSPSPSTTASNPSTTHPIRAASTTTTSTLIGSITSSTLINADPLNSQTTSKSLPLRHLSKTAPKQTQPSSQTSKPHPPKTAFLLKHLRTSLLPAWSYTYPSHPSILCILLHQITLLIPRLGTATIIHLKDLIPIVSSVLMDGFVLGVDASAGTPNSKNAGKGINAGKDEVDKVQEKGMILSALHLLKQILLASWARIGSDSGRRAEVLRALVGCWVNVKVYERERGEDESARGSERVAERGGDGDGDGDGEDQRSDLTLVIKRELGVVGRILVKAVEAAATGEDEVRGFKDDVGKLIVADGSIAAVFGL